MSEVRKALMIEDNEDVVNVFVTAAKEEIALNRHRLIGFDIQVEGETNPLTGLSKALVDPDLEVAIFDINFKDAPVELGRRMDGITMLRQVKEIRHDEVKALVYTAIELTEEDVYSKIGRYNHLSIADAIFTKSGPVIPGSKIVGMQIVELAKFVVQMLIESPRRLRPKLAFYDPPNWVKDSYEKRLKRAFISDQQADLLSGRLRQGELLKIITGPQASGKTRLIKELDELRRGEVQQLIADGRISEKAVRDRIRKSINRISNAYIKSLLMGFSSLSGLNFIYQPRIIAWTTRKPHEGEVHGRDYFFKRRMPPDDLRLTNLFDVTMPSTSRYSIWTQSVEAGLHLADALSDILEKPIFICSVNRSPAYEKLKECFPKAEVVAITTSLNAEYLDSLDENDKKSAPLDHSLQRLVQRRGGSESEEVGQLQQLEIRIDQEMLLVHLREGLLDEIIENPPGAAPEDLLIKFMQAIKEPSKPPDMTLKD